MRGKEGKLIKCCKYVVHNGIFEHVFFGAFTLVKEKAMTFQSWADMLENVQRPNQAQDQS